VVEEISRELPKLASFLTLSPVSNFARWLERGAQGGSSAVISESDRATLSLLERPHWWTDPESSRSCKIRYADGGVLLSAGKDAIRRARSMRWRVSTGQWRGLDAYQLDSPTRRTRRWRKRMA